MRKSTFLIITFLMAGGFLKMKITASIFTPDVLLVMQGIWAIFGLLYYKIKVNDPIRSWSNIRIIYFFLAGVIFSMFSALYFHNQSLVNTAISQRFFYNFLFIFVLLLISPSEEDVFAALRTISILTVSIFLLSIIAPQLFVDKAMILDRSGYKTTDLGFVSFGLQFTLLYFYYLISKVKDTNSVEYFVFATILCFYFILFQNRSTLLVVLPVYIYLLFQIKGKRKIWVYSLLTLVILFSLPELIKISRNLIEESNVQLTDEKYNRWQAVDYYVFEFNKGDLIRQIFGNGQPTFEGEYVKKISFANIERGAYFSDIGLVGDWFLFGIIPILVILYVVLALLLNKQMPLYLKLLSIHILCVPTIFDFHSANGATLFALYFFLFFIYKTQLKTNYGSSVGCYS